jgi:L-lactate dehydrogenase complex protein LldG
MTTREPTRDGSTARGEMLARIRTAIGTPGGAPITVARDYRSTGPHAPGSPELMDLLADRLEDYKATVHRCPPDRVAATVAAALAARQAGTVVVPSGMTPRWQDWPGTPMPDDVEHPLEVTALDRVDGVITGCAVAIAETGTIVLDGSADCGRRAITLVPDYHLVVVRADQVVGTVPEGVARLEPSRPLTMISGPSATSDIELSRVEGVHGPRTLVVVLVE